MYRAFVLTNKQSAKLENLVELFYAKALTSSIPDSMQLLIGGIRNSILSLDPLEQYEIDVLLWMMDLIFIQLGDNLDPLLEATYHKLAGWWPIDPPWYEKIKDYNLQGEKL